MSGRGPGRYRYGGEGDLERWLTKWLHDLEQALPGRLLAYHTRRSDKSPPGFPDWVFAGRAGLMFRELKGAAGKLTPEQGAWLVMLKNLGADADVWRPEDRMSGRISAELRRVAGLGISDRDRRGNDAEN